MPQFASILNSRHFNSSLLSAFLLCQYFLVSFISFLFIIIIIFIHRLRNSIPEIHSSSLFPPSPCPLSFPLPPPPPPNLALSIIDPICAINCLESMNPTDFNLPLDMISRQSVICIEISAIQVPNTPYVIISIVSFAHLSV